MVEDLLLPAPHCPDFDSRWTHLHYWDWSGTNRPIRECIISHHVTSGWVFQGPEVTSVVWTKSPACYNLPEVLARFIFVLTSCVDLVRRVSILSPSCVHPASSCASPLIRVTIGGIGYYLYTMVIQRCNMVLGRQHELERPSLIHRVAYLWHFATLK